MLNAFLRYRSENFDFSKKKKKKIHYIFNNLIFVSPAEMFLWYLFQDFIRFKSIYSLYGPRFSVFISLTRIYTGV